MQDPYLYAETEVLINLFDERNENRLKEIEANYNAIFKDIGDKSNYEYLQRTVFDAINV
jgi:hypothetical protein